MKNRAIRSFMHDLYYNFWVKGLNRRTYTLAEKWPFLEHQVVRYHDATHNLFNHPNQDANRRLLPISMPSRAQRNVEYQDPPFVPMPAHKFQNDTAVQMNSKLRVNKKGEAIIMERDLTWFDVRPNYANPVAMPTAVNYGDQQVLMAWDYEDAPAKRLTTELYLTSPWHSTVGITPVYVISGAQLSEWYEWGGLFPREEFVEGAVDHALFKLPDDVKYDWGPQNMDVAAQAVVMYHKTSKVAEKAYKRQIAEVEQKRRDMSKLQGGIVEESKKVEAQKEEQISA
eukprot:TRINITY_DN58355_c0_g1_i1.p1 TRINITY_DN58355_c0_g1~~TRINITY_DN58355_c0_g1_i1.p1  ORF type:complete len:297 (+),score=40.32 TRINITY_DN58355_c0_g1_i1:41-892(+)